jgi:hypothetical protein
MKKLLSVALLAPALSACGGSASAVPSTLAVPIAAAPPFTMSLPTAALAPHDVTSIAGRLVRLRGALAAVKVATKAPAISAVPIAGPGVSHATVYLVDPSTGVVAPGVPASPLAVTHTNGSGSFSFAIPATFTGPQIGVVAIAGAAAGQTGVTTQHLTVARAIVWIATSPPPAKGYGDVSPFKLYVDSLTPDELTAFGILNAARAADGLPPLFADTTAQMTARVMAAYTQANDCKVPAGPVPSIYHRIGVTFGIVSGADPAYWVEQNVTWSTLITPAGVNAPTKLLGLHAIYNGDPCHGPHPAWKRDYFTSVSFASNATT